MLHIYALIDFILFFNNQTINVVCDSELDEKSDVIWNDNSTVTFKRKRSWHFDFENSNGSLEDLVTTINPVALVRLI